MTEAHNLPVRAVIFASEQVLPPLAFLLHLATSYGHQLASIHIYHTDNGDKSRDPALRLQHTLRKWLELRDLSCTVQITQGGMWPSSVREQLLQWFQTWPDSHWLVNVTGGTKPMSMAATECTLATQDISRRVVYTEFSGWFELDVDESGFLKEQKLDPLDRVVPPLDTLDRLLELDALVRTQFSFADAIIESHSLEPTAVACDVLLQAVVSANWRWQTGFQAVGAHCTNSGDAFERFVGEGLRSCGLRLRHSLKVLHGTKPKREVDLVFCHQGRLVCIDCKLPNADTNAQGTQLADIADLARELGGSGALAIALRPGWPPADEATQRLADALRVKLVTQAHAPRLFTELLALIDRNLSAPDSVLRAQELLLEKARVGNRVLSSGMGIAITPDSSSSTVIQLGTFVQNQAALLQRCWALASLSPRAYLLVVFKNSQHSRQVDPKFKKHLQREMAMLGCSWEELIDSPAQCWCIIRPPPGIKQANIASALDRALAEHRPN